MRCLLLALPLALLPFAIACAADAHDHDHEHGSLGAHVHGAARLDMALEGRTLALELDTPAMNVVGFEHPATSDADKATLALARETLLKPHGLFSIPEAAECTVIKQTLEGPLFGDKADDHGHDNGDADEHEHSDIKGHYQLTCAVPAVLNKLDLTQLFKSFPAFQTIQVQLVTQKRQLGAEVRPSNPVVKF
ncbi:DUF2796 domain-containing protein [Pseudomonas sp. LP_7_YM]|uniref:DUF2796 domain-containing protein n=1 Tax=Pseudomonas sp. LP_7_YM TaxID=2485137 RepID=UPI00105CC1DE|nr:DUF2796 domain-containing protein [Pseudomonas sp. LP_7_YM]TDV61787.1 uncharacterized protein DUF2796 [Pseudomonas sp. LP_7_YM]